MENVGGDWSWVGGDWSWVGGDWSWVGGDWSWVGGVILESDEGRLSQGCSENKG